MNSYHYSVWDGSQEPFQLSHEELIAEISEDLISHGDISRALRRLMQRGIRGRSEQHSLMGLRDMARQLRERRQHHLERYNLGSIMEDLRQKLQETRDIERAGLERRLAESHRQEGSAVQPQDGAEGEGPEAGSGGQGDKAPDQFLSAVEGGIRERAHQGQQAPGGQPDPDLARLLESIASKKLVVINSLPQDMGAAVRALSDYDFMEEEARQKFQELLDMLKERARESLFQNLNQQLQNTTPEQMQGLKDMLRDMNQMLQDQMDGPQPDFGSFMQSWGSLFGPQVPQSLEELMEMLQHQMGQMESLLDSLPPEMREELMEAVNAALQDPELHEEMAEFTTLMDYLYPLDDLRQQYPFAGEESFSFGEAMRLMEEMQRLDEMEREVRAAERQGNLSLIDEERLEETLGEGARQSLERLRQLQEELERAGYIRQRGNRLELTPLGIRKIGQKALRDIFERLKRERLGLHELQTRGVFGELAEDDTKTYEFGDPFHLHMVKTVKNSVLREGPGTPLRLRPEDFEVLREEQTTLSSTVILLDQSRSMEMSGCFDAAKKVSLALHTLIKSQYPRDHLYVIGFADYAWELKSEDLLKVSWGGYSPGTNMQHALQLARSLLTRHRLGTRQVIMVTDGEPTAHLEEGIPFFTYPPSARTFDETLKEVRRCTQEGIVINVFMLEMAYDLVHFVRQMTQMNRGRAFFTTPDNLGEYMLVDYLSNKRRAIRS